MKSFISLTISFLLAALPAVQAHISMISPPPINHPKNLYATQPDSDYASPISASQFPCKNQHHAPAEARQPVATWAAGSAQQFILSTGAPHGGGSCQVSISEDDGVTFRAIKTFIGSCPLDNGGTFPFNVPKETRAGPVLFAWTWFNRIGNREMYMNCASVEITGTGTGLGAEFPLIFEANIGNQCTTVDNVDVLIPNPGKDVVDVSTNAVAPVGAGCVSADSAPNPSAPNPSPSTTAGSSTTTITVTSTITMTSSSTTDTVTATSDPATTTESAVPTKTPPTAGGCVSGTVVCTSETTFSVCTNGKLLPMGEVAPGTTCTNNRIAKRSHVRLSKEHAKRAPYPKPTPGCTEGVLCTSPTTYSICTGGQLGPIIPVAPGTMCVGDKIVKRRSHPKERAKRTPGCAEGGIVCTSLTTWSLCTHGWPYPMGNVAPGTECINNNIVKRSNIRFSDAHKGARRSISWD